MASPNTILLKVNGLSMRYDEARAAGAITPGFLIEHDSTGKVVAHSIAGGAGEIMIATEDSLQGKTIDDAYASTDLVRFHRGQKGDEFYGLVINATGTTLTPASFLESAGNGALRLATGATGGYPFKSVETKENNTGANARVRVRIV